MSYLWNDRINEQFRYLRSLPEWRCRKLLRGPAGGFPRFLYKYRPISADELSGKDAYFADILTNNRLWLSAVADFNDPFDGKIKLDFSLPARQQRNAIVAMYKRAGELSKKRAKRLAIERGAVKSAPDVILKTLHKHQARAGVLSLATDPRNILMWSHYCSGHGGALLQFEVSKDMETFCRSHPISYSDEYPVVKFGSKIGDHLGGSAVEALLHKSKQWEYEKEWRILELESAKSYLSFRPQSLRSIILGANVSAEVSSYVSSVIARRAERGYDTRIYRASLDDARYRLRIKASD